jgi:DNA repair protein RecO (recombination protein O)
VKYINTKAIVLHRIDYGESDRILTLLTSDHGKISVLAKGVRKPKSKLAGGIELFSVSDITYIDGKSDLKTLASAQLSVNYGGIVSNIDRTMTAYDVLKYTNKYTENICEDDYFDIVQVAFAGLEHTSYSSVVWAWFAVRMLQVSGHGVVTGQGADGSALNEQASYVFDYDSMAFAQHASGQFAARHIKFVRLCQTPQVTRLFNIVGASEIADTLKTTLTDCLRYGIQ